LFNTLADQGNTLVIIEHDQQIIAEADFIIELGPGGGTGEGTDPYCFLVVAIKRIAGNTNAFRFLVDKYRNLYGIWYYG